MKDVFYQNLNDGSVELALSNAGYNPKVESNWTTKKAFLVYDNIGTVKTEYNCQQPSFRVGFNKRHNHAQIDVLFDGLVDAFNDSGVEVVRTPCGVKNDIPGSCVDVFGLSTPEEFVDFCDLIKSIVTESDVIATRRSSTEIGVSFEGTFFFDLKERGATMGGMFGNMVCEASGMKLVNMKAEKYTSSGEIDGVEYDDNLDIISIYECQSGIHHGSFLDDNHLDKSLGRYLYDPEIIPTVRKVVILAGGYTKQHLNILKERSSELANRKQPIEIVLLRTVAADTKVGIGIEVVELF